MQFICYHAGTDITSYEEVEFGKFSYTWLCIILFVFFYLLACMDNFKIILILN